VWVPIAENRLRQDLRRFLCGTIWPRADADAVAGAVGERPVRWRMGLIDKLIRFMHYDLGAPAIEVGHHRLAAQAGSTADPIPR
jgi:hypothetical protein